jgi:hypothetical protein
VERVKQCGAAGGRWRNVRRRAGWAVALTLVAVVCRAHDLTPSMGRPATERKHFQGDQFRRAGNPQCVSPLAKPTESPHEIGYYVGGGARERSPRGEPRYHHEGIWGTDYAGMIIPKHVRLGWWHGQRYQGGTGSYATDGPRILHRP